MTLPPAVTTWGLRAGLLLVGALLGGLAQRYLGAPRVEVRTETRDVVREVVKEVVKVEVREVAAKAVTKVVYRDRTTTPDGTCHETSIERTDLAKVNEKATVGARNLEVDKATSHEGITTTTPVLPRWRVALLAGASLREPLLPVAGPLVLGAELDYRLVGPLWGGVWVSSYGAAGASLSLSF